MIDFLNARGNDSRPFTCLDIPAGSVMEADRIVDVLQRGDSLELDAVNLPLYRTAHLISLVHCSEEAERYRDAQLDGETIQQLESEANNHDVILSCTVYDPDLLDWYDSNTRAPFVNLHGGDITYRRLLEAIGNHSIPPLLSTAAATEDEIEQALEWLPDDSVLLHECLGTDTITNVEQLTRCGWLAERFNTPVGYRDSGTVPETLKRILGLIDVWMPQFTDDSSEPGYTLDELTSVMEDIGNYDDDDGLRDSGWLDDESFSSPSGNVQEYRRTYRRSLMATQSLAAGSTLTEGMIREMRPGNGLPADRIKDCVGILVQRPTDPQEMIAY